MRLVILPLLLLACDERSFAPDPSAPSITEPTVDDEPAVDPGYVDAPEQRSLCANDDPAWKPTPVPDVGALPAPQVDSVNKPATGFVPVEPVLFAAHAATTARVEAAMDPERTGVDPVDDPEGYAELKRQVVEQLAD